MAKKDKVNFSDYNFETNPDNYTTCEIDTIKNMMFAGEPIYLAPIKIEHREQFDSLHTSYECCRTWRVGAERITVHLTPASAEVYDFLVNELRAEHRNGFRKSRCKVPGKRGGMIRCDERNRCAECPYGIKAEDREYQEISWDVQVESGYEPTTCDNTAELVMAKLEYQEIRQKISAVDPRAVVAFEMREMGYTIPEIMKKLELSKRSVYQLIKLAKSIR